MGLSKSRHELGKGKEPQTGRTYSVPKTAERPVDRASQASEKTPDIQPAESLQEKKEAAERQWPSSEVEGRTRPGGDGIGEKPAVNSEKKKFAIPQIVIATASKETLISYGSMAMEEQRTIREQAEQLNRAPTTDIGTPVW
ncbi:spermatogenesis-associated protein 33 isoform X1 [Hippopotamus amphibius kiboko]|uniref:spermatogenesis-associated protein 33 isoform X1 n=1 Tax=Hippopotamus amphibius kiboko TaxID=575201 RepID=UPI00259A304B|nr:spermatogenesis-associated protein 33 isoform X1 [Hippopotamus amphibius kiboko]